MPFPLIIINLDRTVNEVLEIAGPGPYDDGHAPNRSNPD